MKFCSSANTIPVCEFDSYPSLSFDSTAVLPTALTCEVELRIPSKYNYDKFKEVMLLASKAIVASEWSRFIVKIVIVIVLVVPHNNQTDVFELF